MAAEDTLAGIWRDIFGVLVRITLGFNPLLRFIEHLDHFRRDLTAQENIEGNIAGCSQIEI
jgi:hypothetical protein